jgi:hypothetical protein
MAALSSTKPANNSMNPTAGMYSGVLL